MQSGGSSHVSKSTTLLSEDSGLGSVAFPEKEENYAEAEKEDEDDLDWEEREDRREKKGEKDIRFLKLDGGRGGKLDDARHVKLDKGKNVKMDEMKNLKINKSMTRSFGIHSGLSQHLKNFENYYYLSQNCKFEGECDAKMKLKERYKTEISEFEKNLVNSLSSKINNTSISTLHPSIFTTHSFHAKKKSNEKHNQFYFDKENNTQRYYEKFQKGFKCTDVDMAMKILKTQYTFDQINLQRSKTKLSSSCYPVFANNFIANSHWKAKDGESNASKCLRDIGEKIEKKYAELSELTRLILKRQQDLEEEEKMMEIKRMRMSDEKNYCYDVKKGVTWSNIRNCDKNDIENSGKKGDVIIKFNENPFRKAMLSVRKKLKIEKKK